MNPPQYFVVRCPNGHDLRTSTDQAGRMLACPICSATFTPEVPPSTAPPTVPGAYSPHTRNRAVTKPAITAWMLALWVTHFTLQLVGACVELASGASSVQSNGITSVIVGLLGCTSMVVWPVAVVMQCMWIYRIHSDARDALGYHDISPGLALGMTFVPIAQYIFTAWSLLRLGRIASSSERTPPEVRVSATRWGVRCVIAGIAMQISALLLLAYFFARMMSTPAGRNPNPDFFAMMEEMQNILASGNVLWYAVANHVVGLLAVLAYAATVRAVEKAVYQPGTRTSAIS